MFLFTSFVQYIDFLILFVLQHQHTGKTFMERISIEDYEYVITFKIIVSVVTARTKELRGHRNEIVSIGKRPKRNCDFFSYSVENE